MHRKRTENLNDSAAKKENRCPKAAAHFPRFYNLKLVERADHPHPVKLYISPAREIDGRDSELFGRFHIRCDGVPDMDDLARRNAGDLQSLSEDIQMRLASLRRPQAEHRPPKACPLSLATVGKRRFRAFSRLPRPFAHVRNRSSERQSDDARKV